MRSSRLSAVLLVLVGAIAAPGAAPPEPAVPGASSPAVLPPPLPPGPAPDLDLVFSAEVAGYVEPCG